ncbi:MAG: cbb3-type cytochrome c oxidase subunit I [Halobacteriales archaeon]
MTETGHSHGLPPRTSIKRWLVTTNHKDVGILYIVTSLFFLVFGGTLALLIRLQLWESGEFLLSGSSFTQAVTAHGLIMVFFFLSPFAFGLANYVVPLQIGAEDLSFPRLNALSYWLYLFAGLLFLTSFFHDAGSLATGWTMYAPLNVPSVLPEPGSTSVILALLLFVASVTVSTINFLVTLHRGRAEGLSLWNMPLFSWSILLTVWMMLFAFAALGAALLILAADHILGSIYFTQVYGGSLLWGHLFWFFGHPEVYIVFFPALGVMFETFQTFTGRRLVGRKWVILAMVLVALQSFLVWMHHMFLSTINLEVKTLMMATTIGISLPFDLMVFAMIYTLIKGRIRFNTPFLFNFGALVLFIIGGITGVFLGAVVLDYEFRGTYWVVAHFHYVMVAGVTALVGGLYYWWPKITGKMYSERLGIAHFATYFVGFNLLYFSMFLAWEMPRRVFTYATGFEAYNQMATVGGFVLGGSFLFMFYNFYRSYHRGPDAEGNPWEYSRTAEWAVDSPPPLENWTGIPSYIGGALEFRDKPESVADGGTVTEADHDRHPDHASIWPLAVSAAVFVALVGFAGGAQAGLYGWLAIIGTVLTLAAAVGFAREDFYAPEPEWGERWPFGGIHKNKLGMWFFLASDIIIFGAFIGAYIFIRYHHGWTAWENVTHGTTPGLVNTLVLLTSSFTVILALVSAQRGNRRGLLASIVATLGLAMTFLTVKSWEWGMLLPEAHSLPEMVTTLVTLSWTGDFFVAQLPNFGNNIQYSTYYVTTGLHAVHVIIGMVAFAYLAVRAYRGAYLDDDQPVENVGLYWHFVDIVWVFLFPLFYIL